MSPMDIKLMRKTQMASARFVCDSRAGKRRVRSSQDMYGPPSTQITFSQRLSSKHFIAQKKCNSVTKGIQIIHTMRLCKFRRKIRELGKGTTSMMVRMCAERWVFAKHCFLCHSAARSEHCEDALPKVGRRDGNFCQPGRTFSCFGGVPQ